MSLPCIAIVCDNRRKQMFLFSAIGSPMAFETRSHISQTSRRRRKALIGDAIFTIPNSRYYPMPHILSGNRGTQMSHAWQTTRSSLCVLILWLSDISACDYLFVTLCDLWSNKSLYYPVNSIYLQLLVYKATWFHPVGFLIDWFSNEFIIDTSHATITSHTMSQINSHRQKCQNVTEMSESHRNIRKSQKCRVKFHIIPEMTSHRLSVVKFEIKISRYF